MFIKTEYKELIDGYIGVCIQDKIIPSMDQISAMVETLFRNGYFDFREFQVAMALLPSNLNDFMIKKWLKQIMLIDENSVVWEIFIKIVKHFATISGDDKENCQEKKIQKEFLKNLSLVPLDSIGKKEGEKSNLDKMKKSVLKDVTKTRKSKQGSLRKTNPF